MIAKDYSTLSGMSSTVVIIKDDADMIKRLAKACVKLNEVSDPSKCVTKAISDCTGIKNADNSSDSADDESDQALTAHDCEE